METAFHLVWLAAICKRHQKLEEFFLFACLSKKNSDTAQVDMENFSTLGYVCVDSWIWDAHLILETYIKFIKE